jgi:hypothetical protein
MRLPLQARISWARSTPAIDRANSATDAKSSGSTNIRGARGVSFSTGFSP